MSVAGLLAGLLSAVVFGLAAVGQARGVRGFADDPDSLGRFVGASARDAGSWLVLVAYGVGFLLHAVAIQLLPLYLAQTTVSAALPVTALASSLVEGRLSGRRWGAVAVLSLGLVLVAAGAGAAGDTRADTPFTVAVLAGVLVLVAATWWGRRRSGVVLGTVAGLGYAGTALAVRGVQTPVSTAVVVCALAVPAFGTLAFWAYSLGMRRAIIAAASGPMVVLQTLVPALLGVALLGDTVRGGWWPVVLVGLVLSTLAAVELGRDGERDGSGEVDQVKSLR